MDARRYRLEAAKLRRQLRTALHSAIEVAIALHKQTHALGIVLLGNHRHAAQVHGATLKALNHNETAQRRMLEKWQCLEQSGVKTVVGVPPLELFLFAIFLQSQQRRMKHVFVFFHINFGSKITHFFAILV